MANIFKFFQPEDIRSMRTLLHENITITGSIVSGTYQENNIKNFGHGMMQKVYDYPYLSSSANGIFDITCGFSSDSSLSGNSATHSQVSKKINVYNSMAQVLVGHDSTGSIQQFDQDGNIVAGGTKLKEVVFMNFARLLTKDEIKKGTFRISLYVDGPGTPAGVDTETTIGDYGAASSYRVNSPAGEYGILYTSSATPDSSSGVGLIYYQAGVVVLTGSIFTGFADIDPESQVETNNFWNDGIVSGTFPALLSGSDIEDVANGLRNRISNIEFNNTTELNSTVYFCRLGPDEFNYSSNPTYTSGSKIVVKNSANDVPRTYFTGIGLYSADNELLFYGKLSEPIQKTPDTPLTIRLRSDF